MTSVVFILGSGRSGTTLLAKVLDSHPQVLYRHEPDSLDVTTEIPFLPDEADTKYAGETRRYVEQLLRNRNEKVSSQLPLFTKSYRSVHQNILHSGIVWTLKGLNGTRRGQSLSIKVPDLISNARRSSVVYLLKSVSSLCRARLFHEALPEAPILHLVRNPCGVISSRLRGIRGGKMPADVFLGPLFRTREVEHYPFTLKEMSERSTEEKMAFVWMVINQKVCDDMSGERLYKRIQYEEFCRQGLNASKELFEFVGLSWTKQSENYLSRLIEMKSESARYFSTRRPLNSGIEKWRGELTVDQQRKIFDIVRHSEVGRLYAEA